MTSELYYRHSGRFDRAAIVTNLALSAVGAAALATIYAYIVLYLPIAGYITFVISAGFGLGVGIVAGVCMRRAKLRNVLLANAFVAIAALVAIYASWAVWTFAFLRRAGIEDVSLIRLFLNPVALWRAAAFINSVGAWSIKAFTPTGVVLWLLWLAEAAIIYVAATIAGVGMVSGHAFCERCERWCEESSDVVHLAAQTPTYVKRRLEGKDLAFLQRLGLARADAKEWFRIDLDGCPDCHMTHTLTLAHVTVTVDRNGKSKESSTSLLNKLLITAEESALVRGMAGPAVASSAAALLAGTPHASKQGG